MPVIDYIAAKGFVIAILAEYRVAVDAYGTVDPFEELERENRNPLLIRQIEPHWIMEGDTIYHNGPGIVKGGASSVSVNATFCTYSADRATPSLKSPDWSFNAVVAIALGMLFPKDAENQGIRDSFKVQGENYLQAIRSGATGLAPLASG